MFFLSIKNVKCVLIGFLLCKVQNMLKFFCIQQKVICMYMKVNFGILLLYYRFLEVLIMLGNRVYFLIIFVSIKILY